MEGGQRTGCAASTCPATRSDRLLCTKGSTWPSILRLAHKTTYLIGRSSLWKHSPLWKHDLLWLADYRGFHRCDCKHCVHKALSVWISFTGLYGKTWYQKEIKTHTHWLHLFSHLARAATTSTLIFQCDVSWTMWVALGQQGSSSMSHGAECCHLLTEERPNKIWAPSFTLTSEPVMHTATE